ncbi:DsbA family protein [Laspinema olomoucense]|uniref:DsbA family protein n=1 Tax=Laspinema olomoucense TaxID=3231600 RepID=UPI0021BAB5CC|nr:DsbA family protein [Laspinema sp. D3c]MCT7995769.1 DsbA family protein [Laspinema sp. D3c]
MQTYPPIASLEKSPDPQTLGQNLPPGAPLEIIYYTDPLCSWSWAVEPQWRRLRYEFGDRLVYRYSMGGLLRDWQQFSDPLNDISRPVQMGPVWIQVRHLTGMPINEGIWVKNPPTSSYPACIAVKAASQQGPDVGESYLRRLREAVMLEGRNIAQREVLLELGAELNPELGFDGDRFERDLDHPDSMEAFRQDLKEMRYCGIARFPSIMLRPNSGRSLLMMGYRPYSVLRDAITQIAPDLEPQRSVTDAISYLTHWETITVPEVAVALNLNIEATTILLDEAVNRGQVEKAGFLYRKTGGGT